MPAAFPFVGGAYESRARSANAQRCVNLYPEASGPDAKGVAALIGTPGLAAWATLGASPIRGLLRFDADTLIAVAGRNVYRVTTAGVATLLGTISPGAGPVSMASNGTVVMLVTGGTDGYWIDPVAGTVQPIADDAFTGGGAVAFLDGYFVWNVPATGKFQLSGLYSQDINGLDFATAEGSPDNLVTLAVDHRELWLFGETTTEVWFNAGTASFPLARISGAFLETGCAAAASVARLDNGVFWLGRDENGGGVVLRSQGYQAQRISTHAVELALAQAGDLSAARAWTYQVEGHSFYVLSAGDRTWCFDVATSLWHERAWRDPADGQLHAHRGGCRVTFAGATLVGDRETGAIYRLDLDTYTDAGAPIPRIRQCPHISSGLRQQFFSSLQVDMDAGVGLVSGQGSDPQAVLQWSDDGGASWSNEHWASIGRLGERKARVRWRRLGRSRDRIFRLTITDPVPVRITGATLDAVAGTS
jgi:hypothetical protein